MADVNIASLVDGLRSCIDGDNQVDALKVLQKLKELGESEQKKLLAESPILKETLNAFIIAQPEIFSQYLNSTDQSVISFIQLVGELRLASATPALLELCAKSTDEDVLQAVILSLGQIGSPESVATLTDYLYSASYDLISAAIIALGDVGNTEALKELAKRLGTDNELDSLIFSLFTQVQNDAAIACLLESISSHHAHIRTFAKEALVQIGAQTVPFLTGNLVVDDKDTVIHSLNVLGQIGDSAAVEPIRKLIQSGPEDANVRFAAYEALGMLPLQKGLYTLTSGLLDEDESVAIASARAIDRSFSELLGKGLKNLLHGSKEDAERMVKVILDSVSDTIFTSLVDDDVFTEVGAKYMPALHPETRGHYRILLQRLGKASSPLNTDGKEEQVRPKIVAVDDSRMILGIYKNILHKLGYDPVLFEFPASALNWLEKEKPVAVLTDLNMPKITGIDLTHQLRKIYPKKLLPIVMVTTQNETEDNRAAFAAGINAIVGKPFTVDSIGEVLSEVL